MSWLSSLFTPWSDSSLMDTLLPNRSGEADAIARQQQTAEGFMNSFKGMFDKYSSQGTDQFSSARKYLDSYGSNMNSTLSGLLSGSRSSMEGYLGNWSSQVMNELNSQEAKIFGGQNPIDSKAAQQYISSGLAPISGVGSQMKWRNMNGMNVAADTDSMRRQLYDAMLNQERNGYGGVSDLEGAYRKAGLFDNKEFSGMWSNAVDLAKTGLSSDKDRLYNEFVSKNASTNASSQRGVLDQVRESVLGSLSNQQNRMKEMFTAKSGQFNTMLEDILSAGRSQSAASGLIGGSQEANLVNPAIQNLGQTFGSQYSEAMLNYGNQELSAIQALGSQELSARLGIDQNRLGALMNLGSTGLNMQSGLNSNELSSTMNLMNSILGGNMGLFGNQMSMTGNLMSGLLQGYSSGMGNYLTSLGNYPDNGLLARLGL